MTKKTALIELPDITEPLLEWYGTHRRELPWRMEKPDPYRVWLSEIMLQQTRIETVREYYTRFLADAPDVAALAALPEERVLKLWQGLGYYSRARNLHAAAKKIVFEYGGIFPDTEAELRKLPGIGSYTAGAIASIAFNRIAPAVDGNVVRVAVRLAAFCGASDAPEFRTKVAALLRPLYPVDRAGDFSQALMELGETLCIPNGEPLCTKCPLKAMCRGCSDGIAAQLPPKRTKRNVPEEKLTVFVLKKDNVWAFRRRGDTGLLAKLWELPNLPGHLSKEDALRYLDTLHLGVQSIRSGVSAQHRFTHKLWDMISYEVKCTLCPETFEWLPPQKPALPSAFQYFLNGEKKK